MNFEIIKLTDYSGPEASFYSVILEGEEHNLFERFLLENEESFYNELEEIIIKMETMAYDTGARRNFFKEYEGRLGDMVCALYDDPPESKLRLYCIRYHFGVVILGGGGLKPQGVRAYQEVPKLNEEADIIKYVSQKIYERQTSGDIRFSKDDLDLIGDLNFYDYE